MTSALYKAEILRYLKSPDTLVLSLIFPPLVLIMKLVGIVDFEKVHTGSLLLLHLLLLHLPSLVDTLFLSRSFLSRGFMIQSKTVGREASLATVFFLITISLLRMFIILLSYFILGFVLLSSLSMIAIEVVMMILVSSIYSLLFTSVSCYLGCDWLTISSGIILTFIIIFRESISEIYSKVIELNFGYILFFSLTIGAFSWLSIYFLIKKRLDTIRE